MVGDIFLFPIHYKYTVHHLRVQFLEKKAVAFLVFFVLVRFHFFQEKYPQMVNGRATKRGKLRPFSSYCFNNVSSGEKGGVKKEKNLSQTTKIKLEQKAISAP